MKLNKDKPYGQVSGEHSAAFEQDGAFFDIHGNEIVVEQEETQPDTGEQDAPPAQKETRSKAVKEDPKAATGKKRGPKAAEEKKSASPVDAQIAAQIGT